MTRRAATLGSVRLSAATVCAAILSAATVCATTLCATPVAQARSDGLDYFAAAALGVSTLGAPIGMGISLARRERVSDLQLVNGYLFSAADLGVGIWAAADPEFGTPAQRTIASIPALVIAAITLPLTIVAHRRRPGEGTPAAAPWGQVIDGFIRNTGLIAGTLALVVNGENKAWLAAAGIGVFNLVLDIRRAIQLSSAITLPPPPGWSLSPHVFESVGGRLGAGALLRVTMR